MTYIRVVLMFLRFTLHARARACGNPLAAGLKMTFITTFFSLEEKSEDSGKRGEILSSSQYPIQNGVVSMKHAQAVEILAMHPLIVG